MDEINKKENDLIESYKSSEKLREQHEQLISDKENILERVSHNSTYGKVLADQISQQSNISNMIPVNLGNLSHMKELSNQKSLNKVHNNSNLSKTKEFSTFLQESISSLCETQNIRFPNIIKNPNIVLGKTVHPTISIEYNRKEIPIKENCLYSSYMTEDSSENNKNNVPRNVRLRKSSIKSIQNPISLYNNDSSCIKYVGIGHYRAKNPNKQQNYYDSPIFPPINKEETEKFSMNKKAVLLRNNKNKNKSTNKN